MISLFKKTVEGLVGTRKKINQLFSSLSGKTLLDESDIEKIEELLLGSDLGWELTGQIIENLKWRHQTISNIIKWKQFESGN